MEMKQLLGKLDLFRGLSDEELSDIVSICEVQTLSSGDVFAVEGEAGNQLCIVQEGLMEVEITGGDDTPPKTLIHLGKGQLIGEMSLVDHGTRSATVRAIQSPTTIIVIDHEDFHQLCRANTQIGYTVMKNMAADLSFKLRHSSYGLRGRSHGHL